MPLTGEIYIASGTDNRLWYGFPTDRGIPLAGQPISGYSSEPDGSLFVRASPPGLVYKKNGQAYLLSGTPIGATSEPLGSLWVASDNYELRFAYGGQAYQVNRHRVRNNLNPNGTSFTLRLQAVYADGQWWSFTGITPGQTCPERIGYLNGFVNSPITQIQVDNGYYTVPSYTPPYNGGVLVLNGTAYENPETYALTFSGLSLSWSPT